MRFPSFLLVLVIVGGSIAVIGCASPPRPDAVVVNVPPPPRPTPVPSSLQNVAEADTDRRAWIDGYYRWTGSEYLWVPGRWEMPPHPGAVWVNGIWAHDRKGWYWIKGYWR